MLGKLKQRVVCPSDIINSALNSLEYYSLFPGGDFTLSADWPSHDLLEIAKLFEGSRSTESGQESIIDTLTLALLAHGAQCLPSEFEWELLADKLSLIYINGFRQLGSRQLRMKAQRANYYIRSMIDFNADLSCEIIEDRRIAISQPWDFLYIDGGEIYIGSGDGANIYINSDYFGHRSFRLKMPTQLAKLGEERIAICSLYHDGWYELDERESPIYCHHDRPVVLVFAKNDEEYFLDIDGGMLSEGAIGKVLSVRCEIGQYLPSWRPDSDYRKGVSARRELGGGVLLELSHELDYLCWIFGKVDWVKATLGQQSDLKLDVEDTAHLTLGFAPVADGHQLIGAINLDFIRHDATRLCTAIGENGSLRWNGLTGEVELYEVGAKEWCELFSHPHQRDESYQAEWQNFIACVTEHKTPLITGEDGLKVLHIIEAVRVSAASDWQVPVEARAQACKVNA